MTQNPVDARILHEKALKTASALKYVVVPLTDGSPRPATFVQTTDDAADIAFGHRPCVFTLPTAYELVRNLKATRGVGLHLYNRSAVPRTRLEILRRQSRIHGVKQYDTNPSPIHFPNTNHNSYPHRILQRPLRRALPRPA